MGFLSDEDQEKCLWRKYSILLALLIKNAALETAVPTPVLGNRRTVIITGGSANASNVTLPDPKVNLKRRVTVVNYSGAAQSIVSHDGTTATIKATNGAAAATLSIPNGAASTTAGARMTFEAIGSKTAALWYLVA